MSNVGIICALFAGLLSFTGLAGLMISHLHLEYGFKSRRLFKAFSSASLLLSVVLASAVKVIPF